MDDESFVARWPRRPRPKEILATLSVARIADYFTVEPAGVLLESTPVDWSKPEYNDVKVAWRDDLPELERRRLEAQMLPKVAYRERVDEAKRPEEVMDTVHDHIWDAVNTHLGTSARSFPELVEQLGIMRFGHRPRVADTFCGSGQIPFEAARLGCDVYASDLNPVGCMLTWGALNIVGGSAENREDLAKAQHELVRRVQVEIDKLGVETDGKGWRAKVFLYCMEARCPQTGWMVPLLPTLIVSKSYHVIAELVPDARHKRYDIVIRSVATEKQLTGATRGTVRSDGRGQDPYLIHTVDGTEYRTKISTLRGDYRKDDGSNGNQPAPVGEARLQAPAQRHLPGAPLLRPVDAPQEEGQGRRIRVPRRHGRGPEARAHRRGLHRRSPRRLAGQGLGAGHAHRARRQDR